MHITSILTDLRQRNITVRVKGNDLSIVAEKGVLSPETREILVNHKQAIVSYLRRLEQREASEIEVVDRRSQLPLSFGQQRLWFLAQLEPASTAYVVPATVRIYGSLQRSLLKRALNQIVDRHEVLRTVFKTEDGEPGQVVLDEMALPLTFVDLRHDSPADRETKLAQCIRNEMSKPFNLSEGPLLRTVVLQLAEQEHVLFVALHQIVADAWSIPILWRELSDIYAAFAKGRPIDLPLPAVQYADYAAWQHRWNESTARTRELAYWEKQLAELVPLILPTDHPRKDQRSQRGATAAFAIPDPWFSNLKLIGLQEEATPFMVFLAAFKVLLSRYSGHSQIAVGTPVANRDRKEVEGLIGFFENTLLLFSQANPSYSFRSFLRQVRKTTLDALENKNLPFEQLVDHLQPERTLNQNPLFQATFIFQNAPLHDLHQGDLTLRPFEVETLTSRFDLTLALTPEEGQLKGRLNYDCELFEPATIHRMITHFQMLLQGIAGQPDQFLAELPLLTETERHQLLVEWNRTAAQDPKETLVEWFDWRADKTPQAMALWCEGESLTYQDLHEKANQLAHYLHNLGIGPEMRVGICMPRSLAMVVTLLGVLKAGAAYVPLDPGYPQERLQFIADDSQISVLISQRALENPFSQNQARIIFLEDVREEVEQCSRQRMENLVRTENLAYLIYTSGSTGKPKGVMVTHGNVVRLMRSTESWFGFNEQDVWTMFHSYAFDFSVWELWGALLYGGRLEVVPYWVSRSPEAFYRLVKERGVTVLNQTPSAFQQFSWEDAMNQSGGGELKLRLVIFGGEALEMSTLRPWFERHGDQKPQMVNMYGITETTVHVTYKVLTQQTAQGNASVIGERIPDLQLYILQEMQPVPVGVAGEIYVGGAGLARGYWQRPELTAERFVPHPFSEGGGERLYRTGDLGRYLADGSLEYLGRIDQQVKIRGHRIELGEIETALEEHEAVRQAVVLAREDQPGEKRLVAYVVREPGCEDLDVSRMRAYLQTRLPEYMVPAGLMLLESMPVTANGKLDRKALPRPEWKADEKTYVAPRNAVERELSRIWSDVLGVERVGIRNNFFELGGDSIISIQILARCRAAGLKLELRQLFQQQTIERLAPLAGWVEEQEDATGEPFSLISADDRSKLPEDVEDAYPLSRLQMGMLFHSDYSEDTPLYYNIDSFYFRAPLDAGVLRQAVAELVERHEVLRTSFHISGYSQPLQCVHRRAEIEVEVEDLRHLGTEEQKEILKTWMEAEKRRGFDASCAGLLRFHIHRRTEETFQFWFTHHHVILDGWSRASLFTELFGCYFGLLKGGWEKKKKLSRCYREFIQAELEAVESDEARKFWAEQLRGMEAPTLPWEKQRTAEPDMKTVMVPIEGEVSGALSAWARQMGVSLKSVLLAAHVRVLSLISGQTDVITGITSDGRIERREGEQVLGLFLNSPPFRMRLGGGSWKDLVQQTARQEGTLLPYRRYPLADIQRIAGRTSLFDVNFNFVHFHVYREIERAGGIEVLDGEPFGLTNFPLNADFNLDPVLSTLLLVLEYDSLQLTREQIQSTAGYYQNVLKHMVRYPGGRYELTSLLSDAERQQLLVEWNRTAVEYPKNDVMKLFEQHADRTPQSVAVEFAEGQLTYAELNRRANQLAWHLEKLRVGPETAVGVCMERSFEMYVALLGIMKAGAVYVPLDPGYPADRLAFMAEDAALKLMLVHDMTMGVAPQSVGCIINLNRDVELIRQQESNPPLKNDPANLAYIIYTSGSTGKPKGVGISYGDLCNQLCWAIRTFQLSAADRFLQKASVSFDSSIEEILTPLAAGARIIASKPRGEHDVEYLAQLVASQGVTCIDVSASLLQAFLDYPDAAVWSSVRLVISGAEALKPELVKTFHTKFSGTLLNTYGPTEATVQCAWADDLQPGKSVPIGKPVDNTRLFVLDEHFQPSPVGVSGELCVGGAGLARGYINQPALTAEKFIPDPFSESGGERLYRTGDLAKWRSDGQLYFIGRLDDQVKLRGYRIELGEIEKVIEGHPQVKQAVVVVREDQPGMPRLVGYVVKTAEDLTLNMVALREYLKKRLPDYMIPAAWMEVKDFPLTPTGKIHRKALPAPAAQLVRAEHVRPRNATEEILVGLWESVLKQDRVSVEANFLDLGGHSLSGMLLISRIRKAFSVEMPLRLLFEKPTVAELAAWIERERSSAKQEPVPAVGLWDRTQPAPLSFAQQRLWFIDQLEPGNTAYNIPLAVRISGKLNREALRRSVQEIVNRHEVLRTRFPQQDGLPIQKIEPEVEVRTEEIDLAAMDQATREEKAARKVAEEAEISFDLAHGPLVRVKLLKLAPQEHVLMVIMHHIVSDGWSTGIMVKEFCQLYEDHCKGQQSGLPELPVQYADFSIWQRNWLQGPVLEKQLGYWKQRLDGVAALDLPTDRNRPAVMSDAGARIGFKIGRQRLQDLNRLSRQQGATLYMTCLAVWQVLLYRYTGQEDIAVGSPVSGRRWTETERLIGFFVNTLVLRTEVRGEQYFSDLLQQVREITLEAHGYQDVPFEKVVEELDPERDLSRTPLFQVMFTLEDNPLVQAKLGEITLTPFNVESRTAKFALSLTFTEEKEELEGSLSYRLDLFEAASIERMIGHYCILLDAIAGGLEKKIGELPLLEEKERQQVLEDWNRTAVEYPKETIVEWFELQAGKTPEAVALEYESGRLTYGELNRLANQLARYLRKLGVGAEVRVGICMERSAEMVVAILGTLKAGGAYVPVDPDYPADRLQFMVEEAQTPVVLAQEKLPMDFSQWKTLVVKMDPQWELFNNESGENLNITIAPENLAYVIYTSGSTGRPKGAMNTHAGLRNRLVWMQEQYQLKADDRVLQKTPYSFDVSVWEFFWPLMVGAELVLARAGGHRDPEYLAELIEQKKITTLHFVPSMLAAFLEAEGDRKCGSVRRVICSGEALSAALVGNFAARMSAELHNLYGPTEASVDVTYWNYDPAETSNRVPIGVPIANTRIYLLDKLEQPVPPLVPGELYISGCGLARGYVNRPDLTAERFVPDHLSGEAGERLYRTGDKARWRRDGQLEYLGRFDDQIKIRGYRIELGEIEAVLLQHPAVAQAAVIVREEGQTERRLVGYVVRNENGIECSSPVLREYLRSRLPEYMVPGAIVELKCLPLTPNGKLDRRALARIAPSEQRQATGYVAPRTPREELLANIWAELLQVERTGIHDNFFELGGHSLLAIQVIARMHASLGCKPPVRTLFEAPTIAGLMAKLDEAERSGKAFSPPPVARRAHGNRIPLSFAQQRLWFLDQLEPGNRVYHIPLTIRLAGELDERAFSSALDEIVRRHEILRTSFPVTEGKPYQMILPSAPVPIEKIDLQDVPLESQEGTLKMLIENQVQKSFDFARGPLFRVALYRVGEQEHVICLVIHHIICDAWSFLVLAKELQVLYNTFCEHGTSPLPELPLQYADVAAWEQEWLRDEVLEGEVRYWSKKLEGCPQILPLPTDFPRPSVQSFDAGAHTHILSPDLTRELQKLCQRLGATQFMVLLALMDVWLFRYSGQSDILIGAPVSNRAEVKTEQLIGLFLNTLVFRTQIDATARFADLVNQVRANALEAYDHQALPFERLVDELKVVRDPSRNPLFQVMLNMGNELNDRLEFTRLLAEGEIQPVSLQARFDIHLNARPSNAGLELTLTYNRGLFQPATVASMLESFAELTRLVIEDPGIAISHLVSRLMHFEQERTLAYKRGDSREQAQKLHRVQRRTVLSELN